MFKLLVDKDGHVGFTRNLKDALQTHKNTWNSVIDKDTTVSVYLTHTLILGNPFTNSGKVETKIIKKIDDRPVVQKHLVEVLEERKNYNFAPLDEVIYEAVLEVTNYIDMSIMFEEAEPVTDTDIIEKIKHSIKTELDHRKVFATVAISPLVENGSIKQVTLVVGL